MFIICRPYHDNGKRTLYLVDTVAMVAQQASYIRHLTDLTIGEYTSSDAVNMWDAEDWEQEFQDNQVALSVFVYVIFTLCKYSANCYTSIPL